MGGGKTPLQQLGPDEQSQYQLSEIARLKAEVGGLRAQMAWREIEDAPMDRLIDIWIKTSDGGVRWAESYYDSICDEWRTSRPSGLLVTVKATAVTHWRPLPSPPHDPLSIEARHMDDDAMPKYVGPGDDE